MEDNIQQFVKEFVLEDAPEKALTWSADYTRGYAAAMKDLIAAAGLDQEEMERLSAGRIAEKHGWKQ